MFRLTNVSLNYGRLRGRVRSRYFDGSQPPVFSWGALSDRKDAAQSECRVHVEACGVSWDSGWVKSCEQSLRYAGAALPEGEPIHLTINVRDNAGNESEPYSATVYNAFVEWKAGWIGAAENAPGRTVYLRREFCLDRPVRCAVLYACGIGYQKLYCNGAALDDTALDPANTDYAATCQYVMYPGFEKYLKPGANCIGALVGCGWRDNVLLRKDGGYLGSDTRRYIGISQLTAMLRITYADGKTEWIHSDESWESGSGAHWKNDIFDGEVYDANRSSVGWCSAGYTGFVPAKVVSAPGGKMQPMLLDPIVEHNVLKPVSVWAMGENRFIADFGRNIAGVVRIHLPAKMNSGQKVTIAHAEELDEDGTLYMAPLRKAKATDLYIASGDGRDLSEWQPIFTYHGFRYVQIEGLDGVDPHSIEAVELHTDMETGSSFRCGNALISKIHELVVATERANQHGILTDCPQRDERQGWMNDATVRFEETPYNFDIGRMFPKLIRDIVDTQNDEGAMTCTAPYVFGNQPADPVCSSFLVAALESWLHVGNKDIIEECFESFEAWENCLLARSDNYIVNYSYYGDWAGPAYACEDGENDGARSKVTPGVFMSTGYSYFNCRLLAKFAGLVGRDEAAAYWSCLAEKVKAAMLEKWYNAAEAKMCTGSQACQAFSLWLGIIPEDDAPRAAKRIHDELTENGYLLTTGNLCSRYIMDVLTDYGYLEDVWTLLTRTEYPSIGYMIQQEATTVWERFELKKNPGMNSHCHPMYGAVDYWFFAYLCGIRPLEDGYSRILVKPFFPRNLLSAQGVVDTVRGEVSVRWMKRYGRLHLHVNIPFGATAEVVFGSETHVVGSGFHTFSAPLDE